MPKPGTPPRPPPGRHHEPHIGHLTVGDATSLLGDLPQRRRDQLKLVGLPAGYRFPPLDGAARRR
ncbi:hypothetical protein ABZ541_05095 [Micromonospora sediminicola]|uniref:hypothetical protein n=1 Tax=Micromonospora sediminicola TaxID=946078 RepID=UPI0033C46A1E